VPHPTPYPRCIFCGERANSREHAIPKWMSKRLGIKTSLIGSGNVKTPREEISFASYRAKIFCESCNAHFKDLEDAAIPLIEPMAKGWEVTLGLSSQRTIALWAAKTTIALLAAAIREVAEVVPAHHRRAIRDLGSPPAEMWVSYFPWDGEPHIWVGTALSTSRKTMRAPRPTRCTPMPPSLLSASWAFKPSDLPIRSRREPSLAASFPASGDSGRRAATSRSGPRLRPSGRTGRTSPILWHSTRSCGRNSRLAMALP